MGKKILAVIGIACLSCLVTVATIRFMPAGILGQDQGPKVLEAEQLDVGTYSTVGAVEKVYDQDLLKKNIFVVRRERTGALFFVEFESRPWRRFKVWQTEWGNRSVRGVSSTHAVQ